MRQAEVHRITGGDTAGVVLFRPAEQVDVAAVAHAQHHQLDILAHDIGNHVIHQVKPLLAGQAADNADDRHIRPDFQAQLLLQGALVDCFGRHVVGGIGGFNHLVAGGIELRGVDAVEDACQVVIF